MSNETDAGAGPPRGRKPPHGAPVLDRTFALLSTFDGGHRAQTLGELTERSGLPRSTTLRLARRLVENGALERRADGSYVVGLRLLEIASLAPRGHGLRQLAMPYLEDLFQVTHQHVLLAVPEGAEALLVERLSARDAGEVDFRVGGRIPLLTTGVGHVFLAEMDVAERTAVLAGIDIARCAGSDDELDRGLADIRRNGFATIARDGRFSVAAPVRDRAGRVTAAISIVIRARGAELRQYIPAVRATALGVSRELRAASA
ncbi:MAG TPA: IclR family transcriptional regulator [Gryllotalpicola sp.]